MLVLLKYVKEIQKNSWSALEMKTAEKVRQEQKSLLNVNDFFKKIIIVGDNIKRSRYDNGIILMSIYDFLLDANSLEY